MPDSLHRPIFRRSFFIAEHCKKLWFLGFFAVFFGGGSSYTFLVNQFNNISDGAWQSGQGILGIAFGQSGVGVLSAFVSFFTSMSWDMVLVLLALVVSGLFFVWITITAQASLIRYIGVLEDKSLPTTTLLWPEIHRANRLFWGNLAVFALANLMAVFVLAVIGLPLLSLVASLFEGWASVAAVLILFNLGVPLVIVFGIITRLAIAYRVLENKGVRDSFVSSLKLFADHWLVVVEVELVMVLIAATVGAGTILASLFLSIPFVLLGFVLFYFGYSAAVVVVATLAAVLGFVLLLALGSFLSVFYHAVWTLLFLRARSEKQLPKLLRLVMGWRNKSGTSTT